MSFLDVFWFILISVGFIAYLMMLFAVVGDLFADHETSGGVKALWVIALLIFPLLTVLAYLLVRGDGMARRSTRSLARAQRQQEDYIRTVAATASPAEQITMAKQLLDSDVITAAEFAALKSKALG